MNKWRKVSLIFCLSLSAACGLKAIPQQIVAGATNSASVASMTSATIGQWSVNNCTGSVDIHTNAETITVPAGNSGSTDIVVANNPDVMRYKKNAGSYTNLTNNATTNISVANGDTLTFDVVISSSCLAVTGSIGTDSATVKDHATGATLDAVSVTW